MSVYANIVHCRRQIRKFQHHRSAVFGEDVSFLYSDIENLIVHRRTPKHTQTNTCSLWVNNKTGFTTTPLTVFSPPISSRSRQNIVTWTSCITLHKQSRDQYAERLNLIRFYPVWSPERASDVLSFSLSPSLSLSLLPSLFLSSVAFGAFSDVKNNRLTLKQGISAFGPLQKSKKETICHLIKT